MQVSKPKIHAAWTEFTVIRTGYDREVKHERQLAGWYVSIGNDVTHFDGWSEAVTHALTYVAKVKAHYSSFSQRYLMGPDGWPVPEIYTSPAMVNDGAARELDRLSSEIERFWYG